MTQKANRPNNPKFNVVKPPAGLSFFSDLRTDSSIYVTKIRAAIDADSVIEILQADKYLFNQIRAAVKKMTGIRLVYARKDDRLYIKPIVQTADEKRLHLLLRYPRTMNELLAAKFELDLTSVLSVMVRNGTAHEVKGKYVLTEKGFDLIAEDSSGTSNTKGAVV